MESQHRPQETRRPPWALWFFWHCSKVPGPPGDLFDGALSWLSNERWDKRFHFLHQHQPCWWKTNWSHTRNFQKASTIYNFSGHCQFDIRWSKYKIAKGQGFGIKLELCKFLLANWTSFASKSSFSMASESTRYSVHVPSFSLLRVQPVDMSEGVLEVVTGLLWPYPFWHWLSRARNPLAAFYPRSNHPLATTKTGKAFGSKIVVSFWKFEHLSLVSAKKKYQSCPFLRGKKWNKPL